MKAMKFKLNVLIAFMLLGLTYSCFDDADDNAVSASEINDFVWKGMNGVYLYKDNIPNLTNDRFSSNGEYADYLNSFSTPFDLFESVIYQRQAVDRFSWIVDDYIALEQQFAGISKRSGYEITFYPIPGNGTDWYGVIRLVLPNGNASVNNLIRGQIITSIDGVALTGVNIASLFAPDSYTIGFADYDNNGTFENLDDDIITPNGQTVTLTKSILTENPVFRSRIFNVNGENVGYLMYNGFTADFDAELNAAFGDFVANNVQQLVLDLRYNPGGSVRTASYLGSMITGQFNGQVFAKLQFNSDLQSNNYNVEFVNQLENGSQINSLYLNKVYVIATGSSASASEMIINSLGAYIDVVHIGYETVGKSQASRTIYDSPNLERQDANPNHLYALQPLIAITVNTFNEKVPSTGLIPSLGFQIKENPSNLGILGNENEPLLGLALTDIAGTGRRMPFNINIPDIVGESNELKLRNNVMYIDDEFTFNINN